MNDSSRPFNEQEGENTMPDKAFTVIARTRVPGFKMRILRKTEETLDLLNEDILYLQKTCIENKGQLSQKTGDGIEVGFNSASDAMTWAISIQNHFNSRERNRLREHLKHAVGIHMNDETSNTEDTNLIAHELCEKATACTILLSQKVYKHASNHFENQATCLGLQKFKSTKQKLELYKVSLSNQNEESLVSLTIKKVLTTLEENPASGIHSPFYFKEKLEENSKNISVDELQEIIQSDPLLTARILSLSNHPEHNPTGKTISAISTSIHMLGLNKIRNLTVQALEKAKEPTFENISASIAHTSAYTSARIAEAIAKSIGLSNNLEDVSIAANLRNTGKILLATILPEEYKEAKRLIPDIGSNNAFKKVFGISHEDLGRFILKSGDSLPRPVLESIQAFPPTRMGESWQNEKESLQAISESAIEITDMSSDSSVTSIQFSECLQKTFVKFGIKNFDEEIFKKELRSFANELDQNSRTRGIESFSEMASNLRRRSLNKEIESSVFNSQSSIEAPQSKNELANEISTLVSQMANPNIKAQEFNKQAIQIITKNTGFKNAVLFQENDSYGNFSTQYATGNLPSLAEVSININTRSIFTVCMEKDKELFIEDAKDKRFNKYLPKWLLSRNPASVLIIPIKDMGKPKGFLCATSDLRSSISELDIRQVRALRILLAIYRRMEIDNNKKQSGQKITQLRMAVA